MVVHAHTLNSQRWPLFVPIQTPDVSLGASASFDLPRLACSGITACLVLRLHPELLPPFSSANFAHGKTATCDLRPCSMGRETPKSASEQRCVGSAV
jgi:hypothetical protein